MRDLFRTAPFRLAASFSAAFGLCTLLLFAFVYWHASALPMRHIDRFLREESRELAAQSPEAARRRVDVGVASDLHRSTVAAVFDAAVSPIAGNLAAWPSGLAVDGRPHSLRLLVAGHAEHVRAIAWRAPDGRLIVVGRDIDQLFATRRAVGRALVAGLVPMVILALAAGVLLSLRTLARLRELNSAIEQIVGGDLSRRLPANRTGDELDRLIRSVNFILAELERLIGELKTVGDNIAHDLRTPLARLRVRLERARDSGAAPDAMRMLLDDGIAEVDGATAIVQALLRLGEIEASQRRAAFGAVDLPDLLGELEDLYRPMAEAKGLAMDFDLQPDLWIPGDRDLLMEALANLMDNAVKFTPRGGSLHVALVRTGEGATVTVADTGPGIPDAERPHVVKRFHRGDRSRHGEGSGLGLSIVAAIARLHGFVLAIQDNAPGCRFVLACCPAEHDGGLAA